MLPGGNCAINIAKCWISSCFGQANTTVVVVREEYQLFG